MPALFTADDILYATNGHLKSGTLDDRKGRVTWNLDDVLPGDWFIAIPTAFQDPHDRLDLALEKGARGLIVNRRTRYSSAPSCDQSTIISVTDTRTALLELVRNWRFSAKPRVIGVSGSCGRRVTMVLLSQLLKDTYKTHLAFMGNLGWFGCMKEVLSMPSDTDILIFEAGAIERGDITRIGGALVPEFAVLTQVRHPLPTEERDSFAAALYCELLETLADFPKNRLAAAVYDDTESLKCRVDEILKDSDLKASRYSKTGPSSLAEEIPESSLEELSEAMQRVLGQAVTRADIWCAVEAAKAMAVSGSTLESLFGLPVHL